MPYILTPEKTRIYQDGLPICGFEERIVRELAKAGSSNHQLILRLLDQGAVLMGTEDSQLLMEEYEMQKQRLAQEGGRSQRPRNGESTWIACSRRAIRSSPSGLPRRFKRARWGCCSWALCTGWMRFDPPIFEWKRSERAYTKLYGGHGPKIAHRPS